MMNGPARAKAAAGQTKRESSPEKKLSFFLWAERGTGRWFFDIYIQGSKYNFKS
jgi:hypothetical protein